MQLVITSRNARTLETWQRVFTNFPQVTFQVALRAETPVDAMAMAPIFAERYGSLPVVDRAQILENHLGDGFPDHIIVPPGLPMIMDSEGNWRIRPEYEGIKPAHHAASHMFRAVGEWNESHDASIDVIEINLPLLDMNSPADESSPQSFMRALEEYTRDIR
jgi:hypothetical protein